MSQTTEIAGLPITASRIPFRENTTTTNPTRTHTRKITNVPAIETADTNINLFHVLFQWKRTEWYRLRPSAQSVGIFY